MLVCLYFPHQSVQKPFDSKQRFSNDSPTFRNQRTRYDRNESIQTRSSRFHTDLGYQRGKAFNTLNDSKQHEVNNRMSPSSRGTLNELNLSSADGGNSIY
jgi:hypothetical protein